MKSTSGDASAEVRAYFAALPPDARKALKTVRGTIQAAVPTATEHFSYRMPGFRLDGKMFVWYAAWKSHVGLYPMTSNIRRAFAADLEGHETSKGTIRFPLAERLPIGLIKRLAKARAAEVRGK